MTTTATLTNSNHSTRLPDHQRVLKAVLLYQGGTANVFSVSAISSSPEERGLTRFLLRSDFRTCEYYARGLAAAGAQVTSMYCNQTGPPEPLQNAIWSYDLEQAPFYSSMGPVNQVPTNEFGDPIGKCGFRTSKERSAWMTSFQQRSSTLEDFSLHGITRLDGIRQACQCSVCRSDN